MSYLFSMSSIMVPVFPASPLQNMTPSTAIPTTNASTTKIAKIVIIASTSANMITGTKGYANE
ncbi:MAG: hypothetical protein WC111_10165 [Candidatus Cloacimonadaceae bacterium]